MKGLILFVMFCRRKTFKKDMKNSSHSTPGTLSPKLGFVSCGITLSAPVSPSKSVESSGSEENRHCTSNVLFKNFNGENYY